MKMKHHLGVRKGKPSFPSAFHWIVEDVIDLNHAVMGKGPMSPWNVFHCVTAPSDITGTGAVLEFSIGRAIPLILGRSVVDGVMRSTGEFKNIVSDLDGKAIMQISRKHEDSFIQNIPMLDEFLSFLEEDCPGIVFLDRSLFVASASASHMRNHEVDRGDNEEKVRFAFFSFPFEPVQLLLAKHGGLGVVGVIDIVQTPVGSGIEEKEVAIGNAEFPIASPTNRITGRTA